MTATLMLMRRGTMMVENQSGTQLIRPEAAEWLFGADAVKTLEATMIRQKTRVASIVVEYTEDSE